MRRPDEMLIKVCGVANIEDALFASSCGADIIGVVLDSRVERHGDSSLVTEIHSAGIKVAGVYTSLQSVMAEYGDEDYIQLHFPHGPETVASVKRDTGKKIISVIQFRDAEGIARLAKAHYSAGADIVLLENKDGVINSIDEIRNIQKAVRTGIAGKIAPGDVIRLAETNPLMIDLSSSLEERPGKKDHRIVADLFSRLEAA